MFESGSCGFNVTSPTHQLCTNLSKKLKASEPSFSLASLKGRLQEHLTYGDAVAIHGEGLAPGENSRKCV